MNCRLLDRLFRIGKMAAVTPSSMETRTENHPRKFYAALLIILFSVGTICSLSAKSFHTHFIHIKMVVNILIDFNLYFFQCYVLLLATFYKREKWYKLIKNLRTPENATETYKLPFYFVFLVSNLFYWAISVVSSYIFWKNFGITEYFRKYFVEQIMSYWRFFYIFLLCTVLQVILNRYKGIYLIIYKEFNQKPINFALFTNSIQKSEFYINLMKESVDIFNDIFGWPITLIISYATLQILNYLDDILMGFNILPEIKDSIITKISNVGIIIISFVSRAVFFLFLSSDFFLGWYDNSHVVV